MKRILLLPALVLLILAGCASKTGSATAEKTDVAPGRILAVEYEAITRGAYKDVIVKKDTLIVKKFRQMKDSSAMSVISDTEWQAVVAEAEKIDLNKLAAIVPPSTKHQFDGALAAYVKITEKDSTYRSSTFDHGNPPAELKALVDKMTALSGEAKE